MSEKTETSGLRIAVLDDYQDVALASADWSSLPLGSEVRVFRDHIRDQAELRERLLGFDVIVAMRERTPFPGSLLDQLPNLRLLVTTGSRNASIDVASAQQRGIVVSGTDGLPYPTAELTWGLILALARKIPSEDRATREGAWQTSLGVGLHGKTLGVLGAGRLGTQVARIGRAFGMRVIAWSPNLTRARAEEAGAQLVNKEELLALSDFLTVHLVLSDKTRHLLGAHELGQLKPSAYLINTSRGPIVDEAALIAALQTQKLSGAGLDVFAEEPLPLTHPLRSLPNTVITPHLGYVTQETYRVFYEHAVENIRAYARGTPIRLVPAPG